VSFIGRELSPLCAVVAATLDRHGVLQEANAGFLRLAAAPGDKAIGGRAARLFVQPSFVSLLHAAPGVDGEVYHGLMTIGDDVTETRTLRGRVWRDGELLRVVAEFDIDELQRHATRMLELNRDYAAAQFELAQTNHKLQQREAQILALSLTDHLTGVGNHRRFEQELTTEIKRFERTGEPLSAFMADLDHFKQINDRYGHETGDVVLAAFGGLLRGQLRATEIASRIGGEEFAVLLPHTDLDDAITTAERIRIAIAAAAIPSMPHGVTASFGVARIEPGEDRAGFMRRVDQALYQAKHRGRDRVVAVA
jgi:diguanylate cyclase (GGDEF)-like protein